MFGEVELVGEAEERSREIRGSRGDRQSWARVGVGRGRRWLGWRKLRVWPDFSTGVPSVPQTVGTPPGAK